MYLIQVDHLVYEQKGGAPFTLVQALREVRGVGNARILRTDGTLVVSRGAGSDVGPLHHAPTGKTVHRRRTRRWVR